MVQLSRKRKYNNNHFIIASRAYFQHGAPEVGVGIGGNPCRLGRHRRGGACGCHLTFRKGVGGYLSSRLVVYRGKPLAAASSSSRSFLEVLIGAGASESWSLVEDPGGRSVREASSFSLIRRCRHLFLLLFLCRFFWVSLCCFRPSTYPCTAWLVALYTKREETLFRNEQLKVTCLLCQRNLLVGLK